MFCYELNNLGSDWLFTADSEEEATKILIKQVGNCNCVEKYENYCESVHVHPEISWRKLMRKEYHKFFVTKLRGGDRKFTCLSENAPQELSDFVRQVHFDHFYKCLPNDWIYETLSEAFFELHEDDIENINIEADCYNTILTSWLHDNCNQYALEYVNEVLKNTESPTDLIDVLQNAQCTAKHNIYTAVNDFINEEN